MRSESSSETGPLLLAAAICTLISCGGPFVSAKHVESCDNLSSAFKWHLAGGPMMGRL